MPAISFELELLSDTSFSATGASIGGGETLTTLPGAALLGAAAARLNPQGADPLSAADFFRACIAGGVRFGDGLPVFGDQVGLPSPLCLHTEKGKTSIYNLARMQRPDGQLDQRRTSYVTADGEVGDVGVRRTLRTALADDGRARDRHLHAIESVAAGTRYRATVACDDAALLERVGRALQSGIRLGRSRGAEFGEVSVKRLPTATAIPTRDVAGDRAVLLCASDVALRHPDTGAPTVEATPQTLGLPPDCTVEADRTFLRLRRYSPFNGHRKRPELERQILQAGSVITVRLGKGTTAETLRKKFASGVGEHTGAGLGVIVVNPLVLANEQPLLTPWKAKVAPTESEPPGDQVGKWLKQQVAHDRNEAAIQKWMESATEVLARFSRVGRSQWGEVRRQARDARFAKKSARDLRDALELWMADGQTFMIWSTRSAGQTATQALMKELSKLELEGPIYAEAVERLAVDVARSQAREEAR